METALRFPFPSCEMCAFLSIERNGIFSFAKVMFASYARHGRCLSPNLKRAYCCRPHLL